MPDSVRDYLRRLEQALRAGNATEHTHRPALKALIEGLRTQTVATNEPAHVACGAPDFAVSARTPAGPLTIGHIETKDVGAPLHEVERGEQLKRYLRSLPNLVLTDYLEFRWYVDGERRATARLGRAAPDGRIARDNAGVQAVESLLGDFLAHTPEPVTKPKDLAERMARLTHIVRDIIIAAFANDRASHTLRDLRTAFAQTLIPDLDQPDKTGQFADMFAQTIAYGLFAARCNHGPAGPFRRLGAAAEIPKTNPFLRKLFTTITGPDLDDEPYCGFVDDLAALLNNANIEEVLAEFGARTRREDPVVHFYETFLATYDPAVRERRGVYYTPEPVVSYIVRSVDHLLRTRFGLPAGLADKATVECVAQPPSAVQGGPGPGGAQPRAAVPHNPHTQSVPKVLILDPACGTGTFLYAVVDHIREQFIAQGNAGMWSGYVRNHLLPRLFGFELLMAPYAVAHLKLGMQLAAQDLPPDQRATWAYDFAGDERVGVYLTNTLEEAERRAEDLFGPLRAITDEANAAARIKRELPIMVVFGNPPWAGVSVNRGDWIVGLLKGKLPSGEPVPSYYEFNGKPLRERKVWLQDDYVKFIRWAQWRIERTGAGVLAFVTNHGYLDNLAFRGMRQQLMRAFSEIYVIDLHGSAMKREQPPSGLADKNVFDIQQGVSIGIFVRQPGAQQPTTVRHVEIWGDRDAKYSWLLSHDLSTTRWHRVATDSTFCFFVPRPDGKRKEYQSLTRLTDAMPKAVTGIVTARDDFALDFGAPPLLERMRAFCDEGVSDADLKEKFGLTENYAWRVPEARTALRADVSRPGTGLSTFTKPLLYRPYDRRVVFYHPAVVWRTRADFMHHMLQGHNLGLITTRQTRDKWDALVTRTIIGHKSCAAYDINSLFPLYLYPSANLPARRQGNLVESSPWPEGPGGRVPNVDPGFIGAMARELGMEFAPDGVGDIPKTFGPEDVLHYIYAVLQSPAYRERYAQLLKIDFPRVPLTSNVELFRALCGLGADLVALHLLEDEYPHASWNRCRRGVPAPRDSATGEERRGAETPRLQECPLAQLITTYPVPGDNMVEKGHPKYLANGRAYISKDDPKAGKQGQYFDGVPPEVWAFHVGGYQVCAKWLKDRVGRQLSYEDLTHYQRVVVALKQTIRLMAAIDSAIDSHGGWPFH